METNVTNIQTHTHVLHAYIYLRRVYKKKFSTSKKIYLFIYLSVCECVKELMRKQQANKLQIWQRTQTQTNTYMYLYTFSTKMPID